jgi:undecaprenyl-diphosphatase
MSDIESHLIEADGSQTVPMRNAPTGARARMIAWARRIEHKECDCIARLSPRKQLLQWFAISINHLGNGWLYAPLTLLVLLSEHPRRYWILLAAGLATICGHLAYPIIKRIARRHRPFSRNPALICLSRPLDRYSFPSGHCMTFTTVLLPIATAFPSSLPLIAGAWALIAWARLASAHHYPSDVLAGTLLGTLVAWPFTALV